VKSTIARELIGAYTAGNQVVYDPFCGCGTILLEAWFAGRNAVGNDLSPYALALAAAKLNPPSSCEVALLKLERLSKMADAEMREVEMRGVPEWVREFFHPRTLKETIAWVRVLREKKESFFLACLLGILHHQRPGFLSYPASHTVPYLRSRSFPRRRFPELYAYRSVNDRLQRKVMRALKRVPLCDRSLRRLVVSGDACKYVPPCRVDAIITSPPYMRQLDYARDNRLRLWFLGVDDWRALDGVITPREEGFLTLMKKCLLLWKQMLVPRGRCILVLGDTSRGHEGDLCRIVERLATKPEMGFSLIGRHSELIPGERRIRRGVVGSMRETVVALSNG
jgi:hypothetical protein